MRYKVLRSRRATLDGRRLSPPSRLTFLSLHTYLRAFLVEEGALAATAERDLDRHADALHVVLLGTAAVDTELDNITSLDLERLALIAGHAEAHGVEEGARLGLGVANVKLAVRHPDLGMAARDDLAAEDNKVNVVLALGITL